LTITKFSELGLAEPIQRALSDRKHVVPTPIQAQAIPELMAGRDMLGIAQTGTGKTAAFALPILHKLSRGQGKSGPRSPRALVLAPTRELAVQIAEEFRLYGRNLHLRQTVIFGGVSQKPQVIALTRGVDIVIATPGRLLDLMGQRHLRLDAIEFFVLDEADRMLDMGFVRDVRKIIQTMPKERQSLLFSATMPGEIARLSDELLNDPVRVEVTPQATPIERIEQSIYHVTAAGKGALLTSIMDNPELSRVIVFARTKHRADRVAELLAKRGHATEAIHGNKSQNHRQRALKRFRAGDARVLVATDIAARGIDIDGVTHIINYELPNEPESYVHRIGRTARAGAGGAAFSFCDPGERAYLRRRTAAAAAPGPTTAPRPAVPSASPSAQAAMPASAPRATPPRTPEPERAGARNTTPGARVIRTESGEPRPRTPLPTERKTTVCRIETPSPPA
jgi:ATP-dependent RNA helicase RhlE